jgi:hypothetical protein
VVQLSVLSNAGKLPQKYDIVEIHSQYALSPLHIFGDTLLGKKKRGNWEEQIVLNGPLNRWAIPVFLASIDNERLHISSTYVIGTRRLDMPHNQIDHDAYGVPRAAAAKVDGGVVGGAVAAFAASMGLEESMLHRVWRTLARENVTGALHNSL